MCGWCELQCIKVLLPFSFPMANIKTNLIPCSDCHQQSSIFNIAMLVFLKQWPLSVWWLCSPLASVRECLFMPCSSLCMFHVSASGPFFIILTWLILSILIQPEYTNLPLHNRTISFCLRQNSDVLLQYYLVII